MEAIHKSKFGRKHRGKSMFQRHALTFNQPSTAQLNTKKDTAMQKRTAKNMFITLGTGLLLTVTVPAFALGYKVVVDTKNDTLTNNGKISGTQVNSGAAVGSQIVAQRARAPMIDVGSLTYISRNNKHINNGKITGNQLNSAGAGSQVVAQESY